MRGVLVAFGELWLKSPPVRRLLTERLKGNMSSLLERADISFRIAEPHSRLFVETEEPVRASEVLGNVFGIAWFSPAWSFGDRKAVERFLEEEWSGLVAEGESFAVRPKGEVEGKKDLIDRVASGVDRDVDLDNPDKTLFIEKRGDDWFFHVNKEEGAGGLPVGSGGRVLTLVSGGIDSPVASYLTMKRGALNIWLHFHSFPLTSKRSMEKVNDLSDLFLKYQPSLKVLMAPLVELQKEVRLKAPVKYRVLLYRRAMLKIGERLAEREDCEALVTGESLGQVSSQTLSNLSITDKGVSRPVLRPLVGMDKKEITEVAREIGSYSISIQPQEDCCTLFVGKGQTAAGRLDEVLDLEDELGFERLCERVVDLTVSNG